MTSSRKKKKVLLKPRFYLFVAIFVAIIAWLVVAIVRFLAPPTVEWGKLSTDQEISAIIVRQEQLVYSTESGRFETVASEGDYIEQGDKVAVLYSSEFSDDDLDTLIAVRQEIKNYQEENIIKNVVYQEIEVLDDEIDRLIGEISEIVQSNTNRVLPAKESELRAFMEQRRLYLNEILYEDSTLTAKFLRESVLVEKISNSITDLFAPSSGVTSFFLDGLETYLTMEKVGSIDVDDYLIIEDRILNSTIESNINEGSIVTADQAIYRVIEQNHWYAIIKLPRSKNTLVKGGTCDINFENYGHTLSNVYVNDVRQYGGKEAIIVLEFNSPIGPMASLRIVSGNLGRSNEGFKIPIEYLTQNGAQSGVLIINEDKSVVFVPVNVIAQDYFEAIVESTADATAPLEEGQKLKKP